MQVYLFLLSAYRYRIYLVRCDGENFVLEVQRLSGGDRRTFISAKLECVHHSIVSCGQELSVNLEKGRERIKEMSTN